MNYEVFNEGQPLYHMSGCRQFILWKPIQVEGEPKPRKVPMNPWTGKACDAHDQEAWVTIAEATVQTQVFPECGLGFVFTENDPFFFLDIDNAWNGEQWSPIATDLCSRFNGCAIEISHSGKGVHIFGRAGQMEHAKKNIDLDLELYTEKRFVALTGVNCTGDCNTDATEMLGKTIAQFFKPKTDQGIVALTDTPDSEWVGPVSNEELIDKMFSSKSPNAVFGYKASIKDLWEANADALGEHFPTGEEKRSYDASSADAALAQHLAFWTGKHGVRMVEMMRMSKLKRAKWDRKGDDYLARTVVNACNMQEKVYKQRKKTEIVLNSEQQQQVYEAISVRSVTRSKAVLADAPRIMPVTLQEEYFNRCVYIIRDNKILTGDGSLLDRQQFNSVMGGYDFVMDVANDKMSKNAWEAFCESRAMDHPKVHHGVFRPKLPPGHIFVEDGKHVVNTFYPIDVPSVAGDITPFITHLTKLFPNERDRKIILSYMAACVQFKGTKFQWCPLIQGAPGNGKTLFTRAVRNAIGRAYCHLPQAHDLENKFNSWLEFCLFIGIEDIYVPEHKTQTLEVIKPMITANEEGICIQGKGSDQRTVDICCNFILNSNHKDAIRKNIDDRRFAVFYTPQQSIADIERDGMGGDYFPNLYRWLREGGYAHVTHLLQNMAIEHEFNPATDCHRAPETSSTKEAISVGKGSIEQEVEAAIDESRVGFSGGYVSSLHLGNLLRTLRADRIIPHKKRSELMASLGYVPHPGLPGGRTNSKMKCDGGKPRLYVCHGHPTMNETDVKNIEADYERSQLS